MSHTQQTSITMIKEGRETALFHNLLNNLICARVRVNRTHTHFICYVQDCNVHLLGKGDRKTKSNSQLICAYIQDLLKINIT